MGWLTPQTGHNGALPRGHPPDVGQPTILTSQIFWGLWGQKSVISPLVYNNNETSASASNSCFINNNDSVVTSNITNRSYKIDNRSNCYDGCRYWCSCEQQYTGKTRNTYSNRINEHLVKTKTFAIFSHKQICCKCIKVCSATFVEDYLDWGKIYTLSEGTLNIRTTLKSCCFLLYIFIYIFWTNVYLLILFCLFHFILL